MARAKRRKSASVQLSILDISGKFMPEDPDRDKLQKEINNWRRIILREIGNVFISQSNLLIQEEKGTTNAAGTIEAISTFLEKLDTLWDELVFSEESRNLIKNLKQYIAVERIRIKDNPVMQKDIAAKAKELAAKLESVPDVALKRAIDF
jgi:hypothetical protein